MSSGVTIAGGKDPAMTASDFPVYLVDGRPSFAPVSVAGRPRVLVISIPKSGTYLVAAFLKELGLVDTGVHVNDDGFHDYRNRTLSEMVSEYRKFRRLYPLSQTLELVREGQFAVGHLTCSPQTVAAAAGCSVIFAKRELRSALVSMMRFMSRPGRGEDWAWKRIEDPRVRLLEFLHDRGPELLRWFESIADWNSQTGILSIRFEDLVRGSRKHAQVLAAKAGIEVSRHRASEVLNQVLCRATKTWSGGISQATTYWSEAAEGLFRELRGPELNRRLGYASQPSARSGKAQPLTMLNVYHRLLEESQRHTVTLRSELEQATSGKALLSRLLADHTAYSWPNLCRVAARAIERCRERGYRSVAFYGVGGHTSRLLPVWEGLGGPSVAALLVSENPGSPKFGRPVIAAGGPIPRDVQAVVPSSHTHEPAMRRNWLALHPEIPWVPLWEPDETASEPVEAHD
ncbi:MAG: hypothetical protein Kow001_11240 [Acidobacteriota bacterium]